MFASTNFIFTYASTDKAIRLIDTAGKIKHTINVCNYQKAGVFNNILSISLEDNVKDYELEFISVADARLALLALKSAINTLKVNCASSGSGGGGTPTPTIEPITATYTQYKTWLAANSLIALQWYDITDTTNALITGVTHTIRLLAKTTNDKHPRGQILSNNVYVTIDTETDNIVSYEDSINNIFILNGDINNSTFVDSDNITITNNSQVKATSSSGILAENGGTLTVDASSQIKIEAGSSIKIANSTNCTFNNIQQDFTLIPQSFTNINVDRNNSIGKGGFLATTNPGGNILLKSYVDLINQDYTFTSNDNTLNVTLHNQISQAGGQFKIRYKGAGTGNKINVYNNSNVLLYTIQDNNKGNTVQFVYNNISGNFEFYTVAISSGVGSKTVQFMSPTNGQVNFNLATPVTVPTEMEMYVNGVKQIYNYDFSYNSGLGMVVFANRLFTISTGDELEFRVY